MFTGIVTHLGRIRRVEGSTDRRLWIASALAYEAVPLGASVAHSGVCLTVVEKAAGAHLVEASAETLARTTLGDWGEGTAVNLETSLKLGDELGGHFVFGHVDAVAQVVEIEPVGDSWRLAVALAPELAPMVAEKGSIAVDGISLTVNAVHADRFELMIVPYTWEHTTLAERAVGDRVNLEVDMLARYVARQLEGPTDHGRR
ncbi:MAG: riboflavin synthase [Alphaproteobacteria bacterium]|jgi:riboflavin synthase|nr:riboflavin synthase [Alphaproteobacteria bacterium]